MSRTINAVLVDDEPGCLKNLQHYITQYCPRIRIAATAADFESAAGLIRSSRFELAFLDVQLFDRSVFDLFPEELGISIPVVFVTAYEQYALSAFRVSAIDYLMKPLERAEIQRCYTKLERHFDAAPVAPERAKRIKLRQGDQVYLVSPEQILMLEAQGFYTSVRFEYDGREREIMLSKPINAVQEDWDCPQLVRVHRSFVVNLRRVKAIRKSAGGLQLSIGGLFVPVAKRRASEFLERYDA